MYTLMKSEQAESESGTAVPQAFQQREVARYDILDDAVEACDKANRALEARHYVMNGSDKEYYADTWID